MTIRSYGDLEVWQLALRLAHMAYDSTNLLPPIEAVASPSDTYHTTASRGPRIGPWHAGGSNSRAALPADPRPAPASAPHTRVRQLSYRLCAAANACSKYPSASLSASTAF
jgi:hypothetical protein